MKNLTILFSLLLLAVTSHAQSLEQTLNQYATTRQSERMYIHYDKSSYAPGETIWFKAYLQSGILPAEKSKTLYVDWYDNQGKLVFRTTDPIVDGISYGQFDLPKEYKSSAVHVQAYTRWMLNFDSSFLYHKDIPILVADSLRTVRKPSVATLTLFPEGGDMIDGLGNKVAFKANDQYGIPQNITGYIAEQGSDKLIDSLQVIHDGMGYFYLTPEKGEKYKAVWFDENRTRHEQLLPAAKESGITLRVGLIKNGRSFYINTDPKGDLAQQSIHIVGTMYQQPVFNITRSFKDGVVEGLVPTTTLPSGILTLTVLDANYRPLAERITFLNHGEYQFEPKMTVQHWGLSKRAKNEIEIEVPDSLSANLSVSVTDLGIDYDSSHTIISHLLLSSEIKGQVYRPAWYFQNQSDSLKRALDLVMLTHGWRRFDWEAMAAGKLPPIKYHADTTYMAISGQIYGATPTQYRQAGDIIMILSNADKKPNFIVAPISPDGSFRVNSELLFDTARVYYQLPKHKGLGNATVTFMNNRLPPASAYKPGNLWNATEDTAGRARHEELIDAFREFQKHNQAKVLETVTIEGKRKDPMEELDKRYASGMFSSGDGYQFDLLNDPMAASSSDIFQYLQGRVAGLQINTSTQPPTLSWRGGSPSIFLDETPTDATMLEGIPVTDIAYVKVFRPPFMGAIGGGGNGAIAIYTRKGGDQPVDQSGGLPQNTIMGYTAIRQFYSPNYETVSPENDKRDLRTTLYWNPEVLTKPGNNKVVLKFFNSDVSGAFRVVIEGMTRDGRLAHIVRTME